MNLEQINKALKTAKAGITIEVHGDRLYLRGTFPPKPGSGREKPYQQRLALRVEGIPVRDNHDGLKYAKATALEMAGQLLKGQFDWAEWVGESPRPARSLGDWVSEFERSYFDRRGNSPETLTTWKTNYLTVFSRLPADSLPDRELLYNFINQGSTANSRSRKKFCLAINALARFAGWDWDFRELQGNYSPAAVKPRELPDDATIDRWFEKIPNPSWRWAFGMLATFGLRSHEIFFLNTDELIDRNIADVLEGKTGPRRVRAFYPEWIERFDLKDIRVPNCTGKTHSDYTLRVCKAFSRYEIPFEALYLRHSYAVRMFRFAVPIETAADEMGHSIDVHKATYLHWMSERTRDETYQRLITHPDRPLPP
ncbi:site-specific integrase [Pannus brasiliensis CCIBt3594]|uniref:Site-specific integrase n=1 Tax=Pannus brasiliensis CCIBt3594 TaxID=1427578 RepID=A0AAW9QHM5_9CHRO